MSRKVYKNPQQALKALKKDLQSVIQNDLHDVVVEHIRKSKEDNVYGVYNPVLYQRRFQDVYDPANFTSGLVDRNKGNDVNYTFDFTVYDVTKGNMYYDQKTKDYGVIRTRSMNAGKPIASLIEFGNGNGGNGIPPMYYDLGFADYEYLQPRPYIEPLSYSLELYTDVISTIGQGLISKGWEVYNTSGISL